MRHKHQWITWPQDNAPSRQICKVCWKLRRQGLFHS